MLLVLSSSGSALAGHAVAQRSRTALLLLHTHRMSSALLLEHRIRPFARLPGLLWLLLTSPTPSNDIAVAVLRIVRRGREISQGKTLILRSGAAGFTSARVRLNIGRPGPWPGYPTAPALYPVPVRQLRALPPASSPPRLATTQLPSAGGSVQPARKGLAPPTSTPCLAIE